MIIEKATMGKTIVAILAGGDSPEAEVSVNGAKFIHSILNREKYTPYLVYIKGKCWEAETENGQRFPIDKNDFSFTSPKGKIIFEYALILIHGTPGENGLLQGYFELMKIPYSSGGVCSSAVTFDKVICKRIVAETGVALAKDILLNKGDKIDVQEIIRKLSLPLFVKPNASGSSFGVTKVKTEAELLPAIENAFNEDDQVLIEEFLEGTEISCGIMIAQGKTYLFPPTEIVSKSEFFDYNAKYNGYSEEITPARISEKATKRVHESLLKIYKQTRCRGLVRIDFIIKNDIPYMIEVNSIPGMSSESIIPKESKVFGLSIPDLFDIIINETITQKC